MGYLCAGSSPLCHFSSLKPFISQEFSLQASSPHIPPVSNHSVTRKGPGPTWAALAGSMWLLDFVQGRFHTSPGGFERTFIKSGNNRGTGGPRREGQQDRDEAAAWLWEPHGLPPAHGRGRERGRGQVRGVSGGRAAAARCSPGCKPCGTLGV